MAPWVALSYRLPREPSRLRLAVWRRLKRLGAVVLHESLWLLPADASTREALEWLAEEIEEQGGTAYLWDLVSLSEAQDQEIVRRFRADAEARYADIVASVRALKRLRGGWRRASSTQHKQAQRRLATLERALRLAQRRDPFRAPGRQAAEQAIGDAARALSESLPVERSRRSA